ncbi:hypothetical protein FA048_16685 [Pedobacter polaris]|uniref:Protochlamydia outer membrane protein domain-containing protein n=1 Tax=Pedobacter polaris TaxID=2571273 RepID=A0A4U1CE95_9SPHI|nr:hypothetical protein [Pedobacter polaris]TKC05366.1 hypothetical protein FA048_16685 [Pedobacter polaris]
MKKIFLSTILLCIAITAFPQKENFSISLHSGLFREDFDWSIAGNMEGKAPNVLSELKWRNLKGIQYNISSSYFLTPRISINGDFTYGKISSGEVNDSDYIEDNRAQSIYDESFLSNKGYFQNLNLNLVVKKDLGRKITLNALIGYDNLVQKLYLVEDPNQPTTENLNSYYKHYWNGLQMGFDLKYLIEKFSVSAKIRSGYYSYYANANWNLIPNFNKPVSFEHKGNAYKYGGSLHLSYLVNRHLEINSTFNITYGATLSGKDYAYFTDNSTATTKFNGGELKSKYAQLGINLTF